MKDIIEKLGLSKEKYLNEFDNLINASEVGMKSGIENRRKQLEYYRELEQQRNEMLEALIDFKSDAEGYGVDTDPELIELVESHLAKFTDIIEKTDPKHRSWEKIKDLL